MKRLGIVVVLGISILLGMNYFSNHFEDGKLLSSENAGPAELRVSQSLIEKVDNPSDFQDMWERFKLEDNKPRINFNQKVVYFVSVIESGCPKEVKQIQSENEEIQLLLKEDMTFLFFDTSCNSIANPRTFVIEMDSEIAEGKELNIIDTN